MMFLVCGLSQIHQVHSILTGDKSTQPHLEQETTALQYLVMLIMESDICETELEFEIGGPQPLYVFVPDYETCPNCPVNVTPVITAPSQNGQGPFYDVWTI